MTLKGILDRKLIMLVGSLVLKRMGTALAVYLTAKGAPADQLDQLLTALAAVVGIGSDILFDVVERKRVEKGARIKAFEAYDGFGYRDEPNADELWLREQR